MTIRLLILTVLALAAPAQVVVQTLPPGYDNTVAPGSFNNGLAPQPAGMRYQWIYDDSYFTTQAPIIIKRIAVRPMGSAAYPNGGCVFPGWFYTTVEIRMASFPVATPNFGPNMDLNMDVDETVVKAAGPLSGGYAAEQPPPGSTPHHWMTIELDTPFTYNPALNQPLVIEWRRCGQYGGFTFDGGFLNASPVTAARSGPDCTGNFGYSFGAPVVQITYEAASSPPTGYPWQRNSPECTSTLDGMTSDGYGPISKTYAPGGSLTYALSSTLAGPGWTVVLAAGPPLPPASAVVAGNQKLHINPFNPNLFAINGIDPATWPALVGPFVFSGFLSGHVSAQAAVMYPGVPSSLVLSAPCEAVVGPRHFASQSGPVGDDVSQVVQVGNVTFYGTLYSEVHVTTNGRVTFGEADGSPLAYPQAAIGGPPFVGAWADTIAAPGDITITHDVGNPLRVSYAVPLDQGHGGCPISTGPVLNVAIEIDSAGQVTLDGINVPTWLGMSLPCFLGMSPGRVGGATDLGMASFMPTATGTAGPTEMIFDFGVTGSFAAGVNSIQFTPMAGGGYSWTALP